MGNIFHAASRHGSDEHIALLFKGAVDARELKLCELIRFLEESGPGLEVLIQSGIVRGVCKVNETDPIIMNSKRHIQLRFMEIKIFHLYASQALFSLTIQSTVISVSSKGRLLLSCQDPQSRIDVVFG